MPPVDVEFSIATTPNGEVAVAELPVPERVLESDEAVKRAAANLVNRVLPQALRQLSPPKSLLFRTPGVQAQVEADLSASKLIIRVPVTRVDLSFDADPNNPCQAQVSVAGADASTVQRVAGMVSDLAKEWLGRSE